MKKTLITALLALSGMASATIIEHIEGDSPYYTTDGSTYTYIRENGQWKYLPNNVTSGSLQGPTPNYWPTNANDALFGFDYDETTGHFTVDDEKSDVSVNDMSCNAVWLGNTNITGGDSTGSGTLTINLAANANVIISADIGWKKDNTIINYHDLTSSSASITQTRGAIWDVKTLTFAASYTMSGNNTVLQQELLLSSGGSGFSGGEQKFIGNFQVTDLNGIPMTCVNDVVNSIEQLQVGQCGLMHTGNSFYLVALSDKAIPEPSTGTLSLLALAGLCARRRKK